MADRPAFSRPSNWSTRSRRCLANFRYSFSRRLGSCASRTWSASSALRKSRFCAAPPAAASNNTASQRIFNSSLLSHYVGQHFIVNFLQFLDRGFHGRPVFHGHALPQCMQPPQHRVNLLLGVFVVFALARLLAAG